MHEVAEILRFVLILCWPQKIDNHGKSSSYPRIDCSFKNASVAHGLYHYLPSLTCNLVMIKYLAGCIMRSIVIWQAAAQVALKERLVLQPMFAIGLGIKSNCDGAASCVPIGNY
jgi:hypothetical protein